jgi:hypothetical protein
LDFILNSAEGNFRNARRGNKPRKLLIILAVQVVETNDLPDDWLYGAHVWGGGVGGGGVENAEITIAIHPVTNEPGPRTRGRRGARPAFCFILISQ